MCLHNWVVAHKPGPGRYKVAPGARRKPDFDRCMTLGLRDFDHCMTLGLRDFDTLALAGQTPLPALHSGDRIARLKLLAAFGRCESL